MTYNHDAIRRVYPNVTYIEDGIGAFDAAGNPVTLDQSKVDAVEIIIAQEQALSVAQRARAAAYTLESDPLFFKAQRGEATIEEWKSKIDEIRTLYPYPAL